jgi:hypothetical protein
VPGPNANVNLEKRQIYNRIIKQFYQLKGQAGMADLLSSLSSCNINVIWKILAGQLENCYSGIRSG